MTFAGSTPAQPKPENPKNMSQPITVTPSASTLALAQELAVTPDSLVKMIIHELTEVPHKGVSNWIRARCGPERIQTGTMIATLEEAARNEIRTELLPEIKLARAVRAISKLDRCD